MKCAKLHRGDFMMIRYWFEFENNSNQDLPFGLTVGCGITACNYEDALAILRQKVFKDRPVAAIKNVIENVDISTLDEGHVLPNVPATVTTKGVWYPAGYSDYFTSF